jgi:hypothetical protein
MFSGERIEMNLEHIVIEGIITGMALRKEKTFAIQLRKKGMSYSQIREKVLVSKSTLSIWLEEHPLSRERLRELRDLSPQRIESFRATMKKKRDARIATQAVRAKKDLGKLSKRELFVAGFFLFWGEGSKSRNGEVSLANTDPIMIKCFLEWLFLLECKREKIHFTLHLYEDMDIQKELSYWSKMLGFPLSAFHKPYIKKSKLSEITYKHGYGHGTCNARYMSQDLNDYVRTGLLRIRELYGSE